VIGPNKRPLPHNIKHSPETDNNATGGVRTGIPSSREALDRAFTGIGRGTTCFLFKVISLNS